MGGKISLREHLPEQRVKGEDTLLSQLRNYLPLHMIPFFSAGLNAAETQVGRTTTTAWRLLLPTAGAL
jgi:hypothetical protein